VPEDYLAGFPWHPHRGIETITHVLAGTVEHGDSIGNSGSIGPGDIQWMTAGSGIIHQEMTVARQLLPGNPRVSFEYISGEGTDSSSRQRWARGESRDGDGFAGDGIPRCLDGFGAS